MGSILAQGQPRPRVYVSSSLDDCRPKTAPVRKGPIVNEPLIEIIQEMLIINSRQNSYYTKDMIQES